MVSHYFVLIDPSHHPSGWKALTPLGLDAEENPNPTSQYF